MDFKQLTYFVTTVQEGNISKAAHKLHISQPPLSTKIKELETELGVILFERGSRKIELTQAGHILCTCHLYFRTYRWRSKRIRRLYTR